MKTLVELFKEKGFSYYQTDKGTCPHYYLEVYDKLFEPFQDKEINLFEVGYDLGGSCKLWADYFSKAKIKAIDIRSYPKPTYSDRISLEVINVNNITPNYFLNFLPDIVIDDGSHKTQDQIHLVKSAYPMLRSGGLILIEDLIDIDKQKIEFEKIGIPFEIVDLRRSGGKIDDVLIIYRKS